MKENNCNKNCNKVLQKNNLVNQVCALLMQNVNIVYYILCKCKYVFELLNIEKALLAENI